MKSLWAPWRIDYIKGEKEDGCIFCNKPKDDNDKENLILYRGKTGYIIMNRYPYSNGHLMAVPYKHTSEIKDLGSEERRELMDLTSKCIDILGAFDAEGFNVGLNMGRAGGAGIEEHLHFHIVPRWSGDTNFMPVISDVRIMPEYLEDTYDALSREIKTLED